LLATMPWLMALTRTPMLSHGVGRMGDMRTWVCSYDKSNLVEAARRLDHVCSRGGCDTHEHRSLTP